MNFEFLKNLRGLGYLYENCSNAEKLAMTMPVQSVFTSRKSAELLARFLYMAAHNQEMEDLSFADLLSDPAVRRFINSREVMNAFHYIRKTGNRAVHADDKERPEDALAVLEDLHYVAGETACLLGLIRDYPVFNKDIGSYPDAIYFDEKNVEEKAREMFLAYVEEFDAQLEREKYLEMKDYDWLRYSIEGSVDMHEYLEFHHQPRSLELIEFLQSYLLTLLRLSIQRSPERAEELKLSRPVILDARLIIGGQAYSNKDPEEFFRAIEKDLPKAKEFIIDLICKGVLREYFNDEDMGFPGERTNMILKDAAWTGFGMRDRLESYKRREFFTYYHMSYLPNSGSFIAAAIDKGRSMQQMDLFDADIKLSPDLTVDCDGLGIFFEGDGDVDEFPEFIEAFKRLARENVYESQLHFCEEAWDPENENYIPDCILSYVQIKADTIGEYNTFLEKLNKLAAMWNGRIKLWADDVDLEASISGTANNVLYNIQEMTLALITSENGELKIVGTNMKRNT
jgi:hypothetical protein